MRRLLVIWAIVLLASTAKVQAQGLLSEKNNFTRQDTLRGSITPERVWWDLTYYHLDIKVKPDEKYISGKNTIQYKVLENNSVMQIDLQPPLKITKAVQNNKELDIRHDGNAHFITLKDPQKVNDINSIDVHYEGHPREAVRAPWDGGISWKKDENGNHFIASSCQGLGASVWWPCKDHMYDEVDSMLISVNVPSKLMDVSNGRLRSVEQYGDTKTYHWIVKNPINNYGVNINIGDYAHFSEVFDGENGNLDMDYYVLKDNLEKAKVHFKDAPKMMKAFEHWFGPYPFYKDGYKLVEVPYLGMEHQSSVTYGNKYMQGYLGKDLSGTGWGLKFDFIIIHESGHEWFANNITYIDIADMWIHESFTNYSESLFLEYYYGKEAGAEYVIGTRKGIQNDRPIIGYYHVNTEGSADMYPKGGNMLHTLRQLVEDDEKWRQILRGLNRTFYHQTVTTQQIENYMSEKTGIDLTEFFNQYLRTTKIPTLEYTIKNKELKYRWTNIIDKFDMPIQVSIDGQEEWLFPKAEWKTKILDSKNVSFEIDPDFYVETKKL
ncbi:Aminopeptidase N [Mariniflexile rhizosphaerae]|uniref:M1 family metallopeptidase n=1 Tax=unclassified Mariniflexile TaxID=2643887 RepID=UPI000CADEB6E|nr:M1 family metallopeptidase [Mariniflexile sp. TRM1-10]AXP79512.1 Aminopeptidase N [Mariniflexile sp. TRM1-10]PLB19468.1 MAG: Peptidase M1 family protein [Flavobacteriaceae bacterium FS1-H7996/R]